MRVHHRAAQFLVGRDFAGGGFQQRRAGEEGFGAAAHHDHVVGEPRHVGTACGGRPVHHRHHRQSSRRELREVAENRAAVDEALDAVLEQVGAGRFDQVHERQFVLEGEVLRAQQLLAAHVLDRAGVDTRVARHHHRAHAGDVADTRDHAAAGNGFLRVGVVEAEAGHRG